MTPASPKRRSLFADKLRDFADVARGDDDVFEHRNTWRNLFRNRIGPTFDGRIIVEIGCADAANLTSMAAKHPRSGFVGIDWKARQIYLGAQLIAAASLSNAMLLCGRAQDLGLMFADGEIDELICFHPEPCDRAQERANRLLNPEFITLADQTLRTGGTFSIKTDHAEYFETLLAATEFGLTELVLSRTLVSHDLWNDPSALARIASRCFAGETTAYERRFVRRGRPIHYIEIEKVLV